MTKKETPSDLSFLILITSIRRTELHLGFNFHYERHSWGEKGATLLIKTGEQTVSQWATLLAASNPGPAPAK
ncbi:hypothetical protein RRG08_057184 [Elysia crispata]|uniref:Uncharacterized protein n=1 Tax=Elysia crispata TaxID=231223 RepID=A0AAE0XX74_9GAST|nr:hypothetical protein RRG08_057184 [Elysia crispata]